MMLLLRHGPTRKDSGPVHRINGWLDDPPTREGRRMAVRQADRLSQMQSDLGVRIGPIVTSDLQRAAQTAAIVGDRLDLPIHPTTALRPWNVGEYQGQPSEDVREDLQYYIHHPDEAPSGGEAYYAFLGRFLPTIQTFFQHPPADGRIPLLVTHGRNILGVKSWIDAGAQGLSVDPHTLTGTLSVDDAGLALAEPPDRFELIDRREGSGIS